MKSNYLLVAGDMDELCTPDDIDVFFSHLTCPRELWLYEGVSTPWARSRRTCTPRVADWMLHTLNNGLPADHDKKVVVPEGQ